MILVPPHRASCWKKSLQAHRRGRDSIRTHVYTYIRSCCVRACVRACVHARETRVDAGARDVTRCATRRPAMCRNCECDVDGSDGEPMPHIRYAHSEPRGCDVTSGLHALSSYPPGQITYSLTSMNRTSHLLLLLPFHFDPETLILLFSENIKALLELS